MNPPNPPSVFNGGTRHEPAKPVTSQIDGYKFDLTGKGTKRVQAGQRGHEKDHWGKRGGNCVIQNNLGN